MRNFLLIFLLALSVVLFSGCIGGEEKTSEKNTTTDKAPVINNMQPENIQVPENKNLTVESEHENSTANPVKENQSIPKMSFTEVPLTKGFSRYIDDIFRFSVDYPENWEQGSVGGLGGKSFNPSDEDSHAASIFVTVYSNESEAKPWIGDREMFEYMKKSGGVMKFENITLNEREGIEAIYNPMFASGMDSAVVWVVFDVEDKYYVFNAFTSKDYKNKYEKVFKTSLNSFLIDKNLKTK